ncbi:MAG: hypothetical protein H0U89_03520 [Acidimicrobiia bacterium]|nr:hypothetical protein [Acidimicrobiia bacterium]
MTDETLCEVLRATALAVAGALAEVEDWRPMTDRPTQYGVDVVADAAALAVLLGEGLGALSEESGRHHPERAITVVLDPVDGSTNASRRLPWYATSLCAVDADGPRAALVVNQATGERFEAVRGAGATCDDVPIAPSGLDDLSMAVVGLAGWPPPDPGWWQFRALGAAALDLCAVAAGRLDGFVTTGHGLNPWDYLGAHLVCEEAGASIRDGDGQPLVVLDEQAKRYPVAGATPMLTDALVAARLRPQPGP